MDNLILKKQRSLFRAKNFPKFGTTLWWGVLSSFAVVYFLLSEQEISSSLKVFEKEKMFRPPTKTLSVMADPLLEEQEPLSLSFHIFPSRVCRGFLKHDRNITSVCLFY